MVCGRSGEILGHDMVDARFERAAHDRIAVLKMAPGASGFEFTRGTRELLHFNRARKNSALPLIAPE